MKMLNNEELSREYQRDNREETFNQIVYNMDGLLKQLANNRVLGMDFEDVYSEMLLELHKAVLAYNGTGKLSTLFVTYGKRRIFKLRQSAGYKKNMVNHGASSIEQGQEMGLDIIDDTANYSKIELMEALKKLKLTDNELKICLIIINEPSKLKNKDIARVLGVTNASIGYFKKSLQKKLMPLMV